MSKAGLFSAVVTTFVAPTSQSLQPDYAAMSASLLYESVLVQRAIANGSPVDAITPSPLNPVIAFAPATTDVWVNGLWFTSLFLSLTTALVAVLVKQWLHHYVALPPSGTPRERSFTRQFRYAGFEKWHVQVIIGLLPVLMHLALAIFLSGLVIFLHPLRAALSWFICAGTAVVYAAYVLAAILPIIFPQCPYRTPLCDLVYLSFCRIVPRVTWYGKKNFLSSIKRRKFGAMFHSLPHVQARTLQSLMAIESKSVRQMSINLAAEALDWLFSVTSNPTVQSIVIQSIGGLPMASEEKLVALRGNNLAMDFLQESLLRRVPGNYPDYELVPEMALELGRLLRFYSRLPWGRSFIATPEFDSFEVTVAILSNGHRLHNGKTESVSPGALFTDIIHSSKLPPRCWYHLMIRSKAVFSPLNPDNDDHANMFPLHLCSALLSSFHASPNGLRQDFDSLLICDFQASVPYFLDKIYDLVLPMFSNFVKDPSLTELSLPESLRVFVAAVEFFLHRLSLPESDMSHTTICQSLLDAVTWIGHETFTSQEATAVMMVLDDILAHCVVPPFNTNPDWSQLCKLTILTYPSLTTVAPSACSLHGLQSMIDFMASQWDQTDEQWSTTTYQSDPACWALTNFLTTHIPVAFTAFLENQCLQFLGNHTFHEASVRMVSAYIARISAMRHGSDGAMEAAHIDYLHNPQNLFTVCSILATHGVENIDRTAIQRDITRLVQVRPRDAAWDECRRKLRDLVQGDGGDFFSEQRVWSRSDHEYRRLQTDEIQAEKDNIRYAIHVLDNFFDSRAHTIMVS